MDTTTFSAGTVLFKKGDDADAAYLVQKGVVEISIGEGDSKKVLGEIAEGGLFGEMALISHAPRMATATTKTDCICIVVPNAVFSTILDKSDAFTRALILSLIGHIRSQHKDDDAAPMPEGDSGAQFFMPTGGGGYKEFKKKT